MIEDERLPEPIPETIEDYAAVRYSQEALELTQDVERALTLAMLGVRGGLSSADLLQLLETLEMGLRFKHGASWHQRETAQVTIAWWDFDTALAEMKADARKEVKT